MSWFEYVTAGFAVFGLTVFVSAVVFFGLFVALNCGGSDRHYPHEQG